MTSLLIKVSYKSVSESHPEAGSIVAVSKLFHPYALRLTPTQKEFKLWDFLDPRDFVGESLFQDVERARVIFSRFRC